MIFTRVVVNEILIYKFESWVFNDLNLQEINEIRKLNQKKELRFKFHRLLLEMWNTIQWGNWLVKKSKKCDWKNEFKIW